MRVRNVPALVFITLYLASIAWYFIGHVQGDPGRSAFAYFWTWDMYPHYEAESVRRIVVGRTESGDFVQLLPAGRDRFRWGNQGQATRYDLDRRADHRNALVETAVSRYAETAPYGALRDVFVIDRYWPVRFNLTDGLYESTYGEANPHREYFRVVEEAQAAEGRLEWRAP